MNQNQNRVEKPEEIDHYFLYGEIEDDEILDMLYMFDNDEGIIPEKEVQQAIKLKDKLTPNLLNLCKNIVKYHADIDFNRIDYLVCLFLLAKFKEKKAFEYLIQMASFGEDWCLDFFGEHIINHSLTKLLFSTFNGDLSLLKKLIEDENAYMLFRTSALDCLSALSALGTINKADTINYYYDLLDSKFSQGEWAKRFLLNNIIKLDPKNLSIKAKMLIEQEDPIFDLQKLLNFTCEPEWEQEIRTHWQSYNIEDVISEVHWLFDVEDEESEIDRDDISVNDANNVFDEDDPDDEIYDEMEDAIDDHIPAYQSPFIRTSPKVRRNDLCPCNSQKKYKKCCLIN